MRCSSGCLFINLSYYGEYVSLWACILVAESIRSYQRIFFALGTVVLCNKVSEPTLNDSRKEAGETSSGQVLRQQIFSNRILLTFIQKPMPETYFTIDST